MCVLFKYVFAFNWVLFSSLAQAKNFNLRNFAGLPTHYAAQSRQSITHPRRATHPLDGRLAPAAAPRPAHGTSEPREERGDAGGGGEGAERGGGLVHVRAGVWERGE